MATTNPHDNNWAALHTREHQSRKLCGHRDIWDSRPGACRVARNSVNCVTDQRRRRQGSDTLSTKLRRLHGHPRPNARARAAATADRGAYRGSAYVDACAVQLPPHASGSFHRRSPRRRVHPLRRIASRTHRRSSRRVRHLRSRKVRALMEDMELHVHRFFCHEFLYGKLCAKCDRLEGKAQ